MVAAPRISGRALALALTMLAGPAWCGPPYTTDDPEPTDTGHWENYLYVAGLASPGQTAGETGFDINYGAARNLQLTLIAPLAFQSGAQGAVGAGDVQLGAKYRFLHPPQTSWAPDIAIFPTLNLPTQARSFGAVRMGAFLPIWAQKDLGQGWTTFGGGGYTINPGPGNRDYTLVGWALARQVSKRLNLGAELYHQTSATVGGKALTVVAAGVIYQLTGHFALMASAGPGLQKSAEAGRAAYFFTLQYTD